MGELKFFKSQKPKFSIYRNYFLGSQVMIEALAKEKVSLPPKEYYYKSIKISPPITQIKKSRSEVTKSTITQLTSAHVVKVRGKKSFFLC